MSADKSEGQSRERRLEKILAEILEAQERQRPIDRNQLIQQNPDFAIELHSFFSNGSAVQRLVNPAEFGDLPTLDSPGGAGRNASVEIVRYFGDYELLSVIAQGGMGVVYKARQKSLNRIVAVKMILAGALATEADVKRFRAEAEAAANLNHPGIAPIYEVGQHDGKHYFSMAYFPGGSLANCVASLVHDPQRAVSILVQVCRAVHFSHEKGVLHRDLKPANILLDDNGSACVSDFGLARRIDSENGLTLSGSVIGTPSYMSPEQARAEKSLTPRSDVYSLGAILYELLTGRPPFRGETPVATFNQILDQEVIAPRRIHREIDVDLETITLKCLEKESNLRYESAAALADDLERWLRGESIIARPVVLPVKAWKWMKRKPTAAALTLMTIVVALLVVVGIPLIKLRERGLQKLVDERNDKLNLESERTAKAANTAELEKSQRVQAEVARDTARAESEANKFEAIKSIVESNLQRISAIRNGDQQGGSRAGLKLVKETARLRQSLIDSATRMGEEAINEAEQFWARALPRLNSEATQLLSNPSLLRLRSFQLPSLQNQSRNDVIDHQRNSLTEIRAVSPSGHWLARPGRTAQGMNLPAIELINTQTGLVESTIDLDSSRANNRLIRESITPRFTADGTLLIAFLEHSLGHGPNEVHRLAVETRDVPKGTLSKATSIDLMEHFPVRPQDKGRIFPEAPVARQFEHATITFNARGDRVTVFSAVSDEFARQVDFTAGRPVGVFDIVKGELVESCMLPNFRPISATCNGDKLLGVKRLKGSTEQPIGPLQFELADISSGKLEPPVSVKLHAQAIWPRQVYFSPDDRWIVETTSDELRILSTSSESIKHIPLVREGNTPWIAPDTFSKLLPKVAFRTDGRLMAVATCDQIYLVSLPDFRVVLRKSHDLQSGRTQTGSFIRPVSAHFITGDQLLVGFAEFHSHIPKGEETWQLWQASDSILKPSLVHRPRSSNSPVSRIPKTASFVGHNSSQIVQTGTSDFRALDLGLALEGIHYGSNGAEATTEFSTLWTRKIDHGPNWKSGQRQATSHRQFLATWELGSTADYDFSGRLFRNGLDVWDSRSGQLLRSFPEHRLLARSRDNRYLAIQRKEISTEVRDSVDLRNRAPIQVWDLVNDEELRQFDSSIWPEYGFEFTSDAQHLLGLGQNNRVLIGDVSSGKVVESLNTRYEAYANLPADPSGKTLLLISTESNPNPSSPNEVTLQVVNTATGDVRHSFQYINDRAAPTPIFDSSGQWLTWSEVRWKVEGGMQYSRLMLWSAKDNALTSIELDIAPRKLVFSEDASRLVVTGVTGRFDTKQQLEIWDLPGKNLLAKSDLSDGTEIEFHLPHNTDKVALWSSFQTQPGESSQPRFELRALNTGEIQSSLPGAIEIAESLSSSYLILRNESGLFQVIDAIRGKLVLESSLPCNKITLSNDGQLAFIPEESCIWRFAEGSRIVLEKPAGEPLTIDPIVNDFEFNEADPHQYSKAWFSQDNQILVSSNQTQGALEVWNTLTGKLVNQIDLRSSHTVRGGSVAKIKGVRISPDRNTIAVNLGGELRLYDLGSARHIRTFPRTGHSGTVQALAVSPNGRLIATGGTDRTVGLWNAASGEYLAMLDGFSEGVCAVSFSPDNSQLLTRDSSGRIALWKLESAGAPVALDSVALVWQSKSPAPDPTCSAIAISPDGKQYASGNADGTVTIGILGTGEEVRLLHPSDSTPVSSVAFADLGRTLVAGYRDGKLRSWNCENGQISYDRNILSGEVRAIAADPAAELLAVGGNDLLLVQQTPPQLMLQLQQTVPIHSLSISPDGRYCLACHIDEGFRRIDLVELRNALAELGVGW